MSFFAVSASVMQGRISHFAVLGMSGFTWGICGGAATHLVYKRCAITANFPPIVWNAAERRKNHAEWGGGGGGGGIWTGKCEKFLTSCPAPPPLPLPRPPGSNKPNTITHQTWLLKLQTLHNLNKYTVKCLSNYRKSRQQSNLLLLTVCAAVHFLIILNDGWWKTDLP